MTVCVSAKSLMTYRHPHDIRTPPCSNKASPTINSAVVLLYQIPFNSNMASITLVN